MLPQLKEKTWEPIKGLPEKITTYLREVRLELQRVSWPSRKEVYGTTIIVVLAVFFFGAYLYIVDIILTRGLEKLFTYFRATP